MTDRDEFLATLRTRLATPAPPNPAHPLPPQNKVAEAKSAFAGLIRKHNLQVIAIGNGSMCREMEQIISDLITEMESPTDGQPAVPDLSYVIANEAGAADYSDSPVAREEFPAADRMTRGTIAIGRRLQDPLAELVKMMEETFGVSAAAPVAVAAAPAGGGEAAAVEEKDNFDVVLEGFGDNKIAVVKVVRELTGLGLKEAKDVVEGAPKPVLEAAAKDKAEEAKAKLEEAGAAVTLK